MGVSGTALAHAPNQSYIFLRINANNIEGRFEITSEDLNNALNLDLAYALTKADLAPHIKAIQQYYLERTSFSSESGNHKILFGEMDNLPVMMGDSTANFIQIPFTLQNTEVVPEKLKIYYNLLFDKDPLHVCMQVVEYNWKAGVYNEETNITLMFDPNNVEGTLDLTSDSILTGFKAMIGSGMHHIFIGLDHILFLLALLLPAVVSRTPGQRDFLNAGQLNAVVFPGFLKPYAEVWEANESFKVSFFYVIKIVTFFTIAHSITLSLAALELVRLPSSLVESIIALSIALAALNNIYPLLAKGKEWIIAFLFGLFHGFGFASVLSDIGLGSDYLTWSLLGFNIGVEIGQIIIVLIIFPILYFLRKTKYYKPILIYGSIFLILVALNWFSDRSMGTDLPLDNIVEKIYNKLLRVIL
jgi:hydrogenase/urease accessory protein HupE